MDPTNIVTALIVAALSGLGGHFFTKTEAVGELQAGQALIPQFRSREVDTMNARMDRQDVDIRELRALLATRCTR